MRILHTMLRVGDLDRSIDFYTSVLGMQLLRRKDYPGGKFTLAFVGYDTEDKAAVLELTYNWGVDKYEIGSGYGHIAIEVDDAYAACDAAAAKGGKILRPAGPMSHGTHRDCVYRRPGWLSDRVHSEGHGGVVAADLWKAR